MPSPSRPLAKSECIAVFAGPSGGHLFPAVAFSESFRQRYPESSIVLVTGERGRRLVERLEGALFEEVYYIRDTPFPSQGFKRLFLFPFQLLSAFSASSRFLSRMKPVLSVGFGSYVAYPGLLVSTWKKIPSLIHEQNITPGRATRYLMRAVDCVALTFRESVSKIQARRSEVVGFPIRSSLARSAKEKKRTPERGRFQLLILGGSQGASSLNEVVFAAFSLLSDEEKPKFVVTHITGENDFAWVKQRYGPLGIATEVYPFFDNMADLYRRSDLAITRSGAGTIFELALYGLPAIVIPYPFAQAHQKENAEVFARNSAVILKEEKELNGRWLAEQIRLLANDSGCRERMSEAISKMACSQASERLVDIAATLLGGPR